ncbi:MAG: hypothetical protein DRP51_04035 [Candidatus Zixiibacteriota bacterium]|nr:MAG: hypothetical protein DRP51_04035 [candidate division Zixibacteria bacterium]
MKKQFLFLIVPILIFIILNCRGTFAPPEGGEERPEPASKETKSRFKPLSQPEDFVIIPRVVSFEPADDSTQHRDGDTPIAITDIDSTGQAGDRVYRIQLFTSKEYGPAIREKNIAVEVFDRPVTMDYEVPYYKIRVGNFSTREEAEKYLPAAREAGYKTAWVVRAYVNVKTLEDVYDGYDEEIFKPFDSTEQLNMEYEADENSLDYQEN